MSVKLNGDKHLLSDDYSIMLILQNPGRDLSIRDVIWGVIKCFLQFLNVSTKKSFISTTLINGEFKDRGIIYYWLKSKCNSLYINTIPESIIETILRRLEDNTIPYYKVVDKDTKELSVVCIGPFWTNKLNKLHVRIEEELLKFVK